MKSTELRIGNLVYGVSDRIETICGITHTGQITTIKAKGTFVNEIEDLSPIPVTSEILHKCCKSWRSFHDGVIIYEFGKFDFWSQHGKVWLNNDSMSLKEILPDIEHVHQLQNLYFSLTNTELTINL